jgi:hypothetical protein
MYPTLQHKLSYDKKKQEFLDSLTVDQLITLRDLLNKDLASTIKPLTSSMCQCEVLARVEENGLTAAKSGW